jgi:hypothetical protein
MPTISGCSGCDGDCQHLRFADFLRDRLAVRQQPSDVRLDGLHCPRPAFLDRVAAREAARQRRDGNEVAAASSCAAVAAAPAVAAAGSWEPGLCSGWPDPAMARSGILTPTPPHSRGIGPPPWVRPELVKLQTGAARARSPDTAGLDLEIRERRGQETRVVVAHVRDIAVDGLRGRSYRALSRSIPCPEPGYHGGARHARLPGYAVVQMYGGDEVFKRTLSRAEFHAAGGQFADMGPGCGRSPRRCARSTSVRGGRLRCRQPAPPGR